MPYKQKNKRKKEKTIILVWIAPTHHQTSCSGWDSPGKSSFQRKGSNGKAVQSEGLVNPLSKSTWSAPSGLTANAVLCIPWPYPLGTPCSVPTDSFLLHVSAISASQSAPSDHRNLLSLGLGSAGELVIAREWTFPGVARNT